MTVDWGYPLPRERAAPVVAAYPCDRNLGAAFVKGLSASGANLAHVQLLNPAGSHLVLMVRRCQVSSDSDTNVALNETTAVLSTPGSPAASRLLPYHHAVAQIRTEQFAAEQGTRILLHAIAARRQWELITGRAIRVHAGESLLAIASVGGVQLHVHFEWDELPADVAAGVLDPPV